MKPCYVCGAGPDDVCQGTDGDVAECPRDQRIDYRDDPKERDEHEFEVYCATHPDYLDTAL